jgi:hypothetical protein
MIACGEAMSIGRRRDEKADARRNKGRAVLWSEGEKDGSNGR